MRGFKRNGVTISPMMLPNKRLPSLTVQIDGDNTIYKVATFTSEINAKWFFDMMEEFLSGMIAEEEHEE